MFNKYLIITPATTNIRSKEEIFRLLRGLNPHKHLIWSEGILDVLDHATATTGYGSKLAIDLTDITPKSQSTTFTEPRIAKPYGGVRYFNTEFCKEFGLLILYAEREWQEQVDVEGYLHSNNITGMKYVVLFDNGAVGSMHNSDLLWLAAANTDPKRDIRLSGDTLIIDARSKRPGYGDNPARFPNVVTSTPDIIHLVSDRWEEYNIGEFIESPSRRYRKLWLSDEAQW
jgi:4-hydroxy-3-polyprenylbenzoate decarboxylase